SLEPWDRLLMALHQHERPAKAESGIAVVRIERHRAAEMLLGSLGPLLGEIELAEIERDVRIAGELLQCLYEPVARPLQVARLGLHPRGAGPGPPPAAAEPRAPWHRPGAHHRTVRAPPPSVPAAEAVPCSYFPCADSEGKRLELQPGKPPDRRGCRTVRVLD